MCFRSCPLNTCSSCFKELPCSSFTLIFFCARCLISNQWRFCGTQEQLCEKCKFQGPLEVRHFWCNGSLLRSQVYHHRARPGIHCCMSRLHDSWQFSLILCPVSYCGRLSVRHDVTSAVPSATLCCQCSLHHIFVTVKVCSCKPALFYTWNLLLVIRQLDCWITVGPFFNVLSFPQKRKNKCWLWHAKYLFLVDWRQVIFFYVLFYY